MFSLQKELKNTARYARKHSNIIYTTLYTFSVLFANYPTTSNNTSYTKGQPARQKKREPTKAVTEETLIIILNI